MQAYMVCLRMRLELQTFWHSSAHVLGEALESCFGAKLTIGPALEEGFYYDCYLGERTLTEADKAALEKRIQEVRTSLLPLFCRHVKHLE